MRTKKYSFLVLVILIFIVSCNPTRQTIQESISQTQTALPIATPTLTPTPVPLSSLNLKSILLVEGDLPTGYVVDPFITDLSPTIYEGLVGVEYFLSQEFSKTGEGGGHVAVFLFNSEEDRNNAFLSIMSSNYNEFKNAIENTKIEDVTNIGEAGKLITSKNSILNITITTAQIGFVRCHAFVIIGKTIDDSSIVVSYAKKLDERLSEIVCPLNIY